MLPDYMRPVPGDGTGNDMRWDSLTLEGELYVRTGNYRLLRDARVRQGRFVELEGNPRIAVAYYCMAFYSDLNGFDSIERLLYYQQDNFRSWRSSASVDAGIVNKIFDLCCRCGISEKELPHIFHRFYTTHKQDGGQGLGLPIAKTIITEHGGAIDVASVEGRGTTFTVRIPLVSQA